MPSINYYNRSAPFWDFIASMEEQGATNPMFGNRNNNNNDSNDPNKSSNNDNNPTGPNLFGQGFPAHPAFAGFGSMPHRGRGPQYNPWEPQPTGKMPPENNEKEGEAGPSNPYAPPGPPPVPAQEGGAAFGSSSSRGFTRGTRGCNGWGGRGRGPYHGGPYHTGPSGMFGGFGELANMFQEQLFGEQAGNKSKQEDFKPEVDVFDTSESFVVHVSLSGAKKEDVGVNWDAATSELSIAGVIHRPGDEEFLKTLAMDERKVGAFERKVRLGSRASPAQVDVDGIAARMEDGILTVEVPKLDAGYVEIKKVDIE